MTSMTASFTPEPPLSELSLGVVIKRLLRASFYVLVGLPLAVAGFMIVVAGLSLGAGLLIALAGVPMLVFTLFLAQAFATVELAQVTTVVGRAGGPVTVPRCSSIADYSVLLREGLELILAEAGHEVVVAVGEGPSFVGAVLANRPDCSIVDVRMPPVQNRRGPSGRGRGAPDLDGGPVVVLSQYVEVSSADELLATGCEGSGTG